jgi:hypothetical protein
MSSRVTSNEINKVLLLGRRCEDSHKNNSNWEALNSGDAALTYEEAMLRTIRAIKLTEYLTYARQCYRRDQGLLSANC